MNVFELLFFVLNICMGVVVAKHAGHRFGWVGYPLGFIFGFGASIVGLITLAQLLSLFERAAYRGFPGLPQCRTGRCKENDYYAVKDKGNVFWECQCGGRYDKVGRRFYEVLPDGSRKPYLIWRPFRDWFPDDGSSDSEHSRRGD
jgi:hypothetical protein